MLLKIKNIHFFNNINLRLPLPFKSVAFTSNRPVSLSTSVTQSNRLKIVSEPLTLFRNESQNLPTEPTVSIPKRRFPNPPICWRLLGICLNFVRIYRTTYLTRYRNVEKVWYKAHEKIGRRNEEWVGRSLSNAFFLEDLFSMWSKQPTGDYHSVKGLRDLAHGHPRTKFSRRLVVLRIYGEKIHSWLRGGAFHASATLGSWGRKSRLTSSLCDDLWSTAVLRTSDRSWPRLPSILRVTICLKTYRMDVGRFIEVLTVNNTWRSVLCL